MKKIIYILACSCLLGLNACQDSFLNLDPLDSKTDAVISKRRSISVSMPTVYILN